MGLKKTYQSYTDAYWRIIIDCDNNRENRTGESFVIFTVLGYANKSDSDADINDSQYLFRGNKLFSGSEYPCLKSFVNAEGNNSQKAVYIKITDAPGTFGEFKVIDRFNNIEWFDLSDAVDA